MRRFYSHYTFIYPGVFLKNCVVELDGEGRITDIFKFEKEIANTSFFNGALLFFPSEVRVTTDMLDETHRQIALGAVAEVDIKLPPGGIFRVYDSDGLAVNIK